jgi:hypothetical protein
MHNYECLVGQIINGLEIQTILRYESGLPVYGCRCLECGSTLVPVRHAQFRQGNARCIASIHGKANRAPGGTALAGTGSYRATGSARSEKERAAFDRSQQAQHRRTTLAEYDPEGLIAFKNAQRREEQRRWKEQEKRIDAQYLEYKRRMIVDRGLALDQLCSRHVWGKIGDDDRQRILRLIRQEDSSERA